MRHDFDGDGTHDCTVPNTRSSPAQAISMATACLLNCRSQSAIIAALVDGQRRSSDSASLSSSGVRSPLSSFAFSSAIRDRLNIAAWSLSILGVERVVFDPPEHLVVANDLGVVAG
jgi:hypothetical protein